MSVNYSSKYKNEHEFLIENIKEAVFKADSEGIIKYLNSSWTELTGFSFEEGRDKPFLDYIHSEDIDRNIKLFKTTVKEKRESLKSKTRYLTKNGEYIWVEIILKIILDKEGEVISLIGTITDINDEDDRYIQLKLRGIDELRQAENKILYMSYYDKLTDLPNRDYLQEYFNSKYSNINIFKNKLALLFLNIDRFKNINDSLGYRIGDELLRLIALRFDEFLKDKKATLIRMNGDKFIILLEFERLEDIDSLVKDIFTILKQPFKVDVHELFITTSIGVSICSDYCDNLDDLMKYAETAMHRAKDDGKNGYQYFKESMGIENIRELTLEHQLRKALENNEFFLVYQPKVNSCDGKIESVEALLRWKSDELGLVTPAEFIPIAEETGLIIPIGAWVLNEACKQAKYWYEKGYKIIVSVNISPVQLQRYNFLDLVKSVIKNTQIEPRYLDLEITENGIMKDLEKSEEIMKELSLMGINISIDDFGTGFSSLSYIKRFKSNTLKIDRSFVKDIPNDENDMSITLAVINMARSLKMITVAEGVETIEQLNFLRENKCDIIQGYYFSKPISPKEMEKLLEQNRTKPNC